MSPKLESQRRREPPNDGLVTTLFSHLAAMLAIEQASELAKQEQLSPSAAIQVEGNAIQRAVEQESCRLTWNHDQRLYELQHPALSPKQKQKQKQPALIGAAGIPLSPVIQQQNHKYPATLHITVSTPATGHPQPPAILVTSPTPTNATSSSRLAATPRTSTLPHTADTDGPLASLDLGSGTLNINAGAIIAAIPSLYAVDYVVAAVLAVGVADDSTRCVFSDMEVLGEKCQGCAGAGAGRGGSGGGFFDGEFVTMIAEREDGDGDAGEGELVRVKSAQTSPTDSNNFRQKIKNTFLTFWTRFHHNTNNDEEDNNSKTPSQQQPPPPLKPKKSKKITIEKFDLEKYTRYGPESSREGQELPGVTRGILRVLFWGLDVLVRVLTLVVKTVAWGVVVITRCVSSERF